ncbi:MAG: hypothetical protein ACYCZI_13020, partial [Metallibacterium scheffleri]
LGQHAPPRQHAADDDQQQQKREGGDRQLHAMASSEGRSSFAHHQANPRPRHKLSGMTNHGICEGGNPATWHFNKYRCWIPVPDTSTRG